MNDDRAPVDEASSGDQAQPRPALAEGTLFAGRYRILRCVAMGGMGSVYEVVHLETERRRALKVMHPYLFQSDEMRERFKREARIAAQVESEYIVDVSDAGVDEATRIPFLVMELLQGEEIGQRLQRMGPLPAAEVVTYLHQIGLALDKTHAKSIVHRDLKPENVFLTQREDGSPRIKILDFGVAKLVAESTTAVGATRSLGTPLYMAPEQFRVGSKLTSAADIYALGMMAFTLLVGDPYWGPEARSAGDVIAFAMAAVRGPQEPALQRAAACGVVLPPGFDPWFARMTTVSPRDRFARASEAVRALREALGVDPGMSHVALPEVSDMAAAIAIAAAPTVLAVEPPASLSVPLSRRRGAIVAGAALSLVVGLAVAAWLAAPDGSSPPPPHGMDGLAGTAVLPDPAAGATAPGEVSVTAGDPIAGPLSSGNAVPASTTAPVGPTATANTSRAVKPVTGSRGKKTPANATAATTASANATAATTASANATAAKPTATPPAIATPPATTTPAVKPGPASTRPIFGRD